MIEKGALFARVAVPIPLPEALTYSVPPAFAGWARPGVRARVRVGKRRLIGVVIGLAAEAPAGVRMRSLEEVLDREPVLPEELLDLAAFVADYYLAPIGEVVRSMLPSDLPPWGDRKVWLTDAGAIAPPRNSGEEKVVETLRNAGRLTLAELQTALAPPAAEDPDLGLDLDLAAVVEPMIAAGRLATGESRRAVGARYLPAVELASGDLDELRQRCGRSAPARSVVDLLSTLGRPALVSEVLAGARCRSGVIRRLVDLGVLHRFTQVERLPMARHSFGGGDSREGGGGEEPLVLRTDQTAAVGELTGAVRRGGFAAFLLAGITGSGKTEVYLRAVEETLARGRSSILLVPEIALVPALAGTLRRRFGESLAILHSALSASERHQEWERIRRGHARVVLGSRSAVLAPVRDLGVIVVDEEQDTSYKQDVTPRYNGRDVALVRCRAAGAVTVLVSATPSLESRRNSETGKLTQLTLTERAGQGALPEGVLVDLREEGARRRPGEIHFSDRLKKELADAFEAGDQVILLRNRRGYSPMLLCRACGDDFRCDACGLPRTFHQRAGLLVCHYCGSRLPAPRSCPSCGEETLEPIGAGTERVEEIFAELFPGIPLGVLDRDTVRAPGGAAAILERFAHGDSRVLIGTQMVSKGHHFPRVALAAVLSADTYLGFPDFRAVERTYNLLTQLAGRAGRGERAGRVVIQTYHPEHYAIQAALAHDDRAFAAEEMRFRRVFHYPPYTRMVQLLVRDRARKRAEEAIAELAATISRHPLAERIRVSGPAPAPLERLRDRWRYQLLLRTASSRDLRELLRAVLPTKAPYDLVVDVDPTELL